MKEKKEFKPLVYVCAPYSGNIKENIKRATKFAEFIYNQNCIPITPHLMFPFLDDTKKADRYNAIFMDIILLGKANEVWVLAENITKGMSKELEISKKRFQKVRYFNNDFKEVAINEVNNI
ncbi:DUF4406 domain-containing protein [Ligilactobacillus ceti]|uniref:DUF7768 domain-containing protein n=1 Tax=Ligilactobacillus ceti DSM 22408 TaxID=1122146 RepID=A0A0R2KQ19_9LACO|nr:DUF4406 domain-containing protein [Ligilactobacillus ceti]KRN88714.1 hypothetical protein IV53_GL000681 [Ligilactobacillus ceti DSM 22408]